jgi:multicomponent Na+:H+ antiporter subunit E
VGNRVASLTLWCFAVWVLLTWTLTAEQLLVGAGVSLAVAVCLAPVGPVAPPWRVLEPRRAALALALLGRTVFGIVTANLRLTRRIWARSPLVSSGIVRVHTEVRSDAGLAAVGLLSSLMVDNQILDVDRRRHELLYHAITVPDGDERAAYDEINGPIEPWIARLERR